MRLHVWLLLAVLGPGLPHTAHTQTAPKSNYRAAPRVAIAHTTRPAAMVKAPAPYRGSLMSGRDLPCRQLRDRLSVAPPLGAHWPRLSLRHPFFTPDDKRQVKVTHPFLTPDTQKRVKVIPLKKP